MPRSSTPMPGRVRVALALLALYALFLLFFAATSNAPRQDFAAAGLTILFVFFLARGHPLARQWAQYIASLLLLVAIVLGTLGAPETPDLAFWLAVVFSGAIGVVLLWGLTGSEARKFFDLYCGHCKTYKVRAASLLFNWIKCRECGRKWKVHDPRVDAEVFD